jgi:hypothetical protein
MASPKGNFGRLVAQLSMPVNVVDADAFVVPRVVKRADAERVALEAINEGYLRPADIARAEIAPIMLAWVPLWRVDVTVEGFHLGLTRSGGSGGLLPTGGARHRDEIKLILGRRYLPVDPTAKVKITPPEMVPRAQQKIAEGELVLPDVTRREAEQEACEQLRRAVEPSSALFSKFDARVRSAALCHYPLMIIRYRYAGEATADAAPEECHVAVSGRTGKIVSDKHPSALRSVASKIKSWFQ